MPIWADPARGERVRLLADDDMTLLGMFVAPPAARPTAADLRAVPGADLDRFARVAQRDLPGVRVTTGPDEAAALVAVGATHDRTLVHMVRARLQEDPPPLRWAAPHLPAGVELVGADTADENVLAAAQQLAFGPGHPDHLATAEAQEAGLLHSLLVGELLGPLYADASALAVGENGSVLASLLATRWEGIGEEWPGGPWVVDLFAVPGAPLLLGRSLLARAVAVCALDGHDAVGLTVTATNRARRLYERLGFVDAFSRVSLDLPGRWAEGP
ncbi:MAG: hypothetical protein ABIS47_05105 [Acidimicrobiales bacterium]